MLRNSILYRRWWYVKRRNIRRLRMLLRVAITAFITCIVLLITHINILGFLGL
jgi:hypothetical protein